MNKSELIELLLSSDEEEVFVEIDGWQHEVVVEHHEATFDGFDTVFPASISLKAKDNG